MKSALHIELENIDAATHILTIARLLDFPSDDEGVYTDEMFWDDCVYPALRILFIHLSHYIENSDDSHRLLTAVDGPGRCLAMCHTIENTINCIRAMAEQSRRKDSLPPSVSK